MMDTKTAILLLSMIIVALCGVMLWLVTRDKS